MARYVSRLRANRQDNNITMKSIDQSLNNCESMVQSIVQSPGFGNTPSNLDFVCAYQVNYVYMSKVLCTCLILLCTLHDKMNFMFLKYVALSVFTSRVENSSLDECQYSWQS